ncbi:ABC transporter ATP-binding protein [Saccharibacillus sp. CPCC 101409]|uniref:ABC transporter ATP-binding protein n=1 Tax=Saccharibacillus sp. CPCC 101409 TaxID=3058041 RepID=UPI00267354E5|nr:ABC transporter ATP-binding protein [Saccharibacillus sp. CPCC 101409]MDO3411510.1 ABC transporter ATP-binding protein [Saccharibacillus sp. CPCC 101409]
MQEMIRTEKLTKRYGDYPVLSDVSLSVNRGEIYGFLGLNGAGKTTTIRMLLGMIRPTSGDIYIRGRCLRDAKPDLWRHVGYLVETPYAYPNFTVRDNLRMIARLRGLSEQSAADAVMEKLQLTRYANTKSKNLSLGNAQKLGLAKAMIHNPAILILDEPTNALDPAGIVQVRELLRSLAEHEGVTVFISSHILEEMSKLASRIGIIHGGSLVQEITSRQFEQLRRKRLVADVRGASVAAAELLTGAGYTVQPTAEGRIEIAGEHALGQPERIARLIVDAKLPLAALKVEEEGLESYFLNIVGAGGPSSREEEASADRELEQGGSSK